MMQRFYYSATCSGFITQDAESILGRLSACNEFDLTQEQRGAWLEEIAVMKDTLKSLGKSGQIVFEYTIPRLGKRVDVVLLVDGIVFTIEFKAGADEYLVNDKEQVWDYALDLKNFHEESRNLVIVPILVATEAKEYSNSFLCQYDDNVYNPLFSNSQTLLGIIKAILEHEPEHPSIDAHEWLYSRYNPTPTIIQAASALYMNHSVEDITKHEADKAGIDTCTAFILDVIKRSKENHQKSICFVTGVPGAGKTLVGLNVAIQQEQGDLAVYLSGNGPLVKVLTEALARDKVKKEKDAGKRCTKTEAERQVSRFIQIIHRYRDNMLAKLKQPIQGNAIEIDPAKVSKAAKADAAEVENVAIFDEAQRMWDMRHLSAWLARKKGLAGFPMSEGEFLIWSLDQHKDWATIVCLVGGGQEINTGEAGISEWIKSLNETFTHWKVYISPKLTEAEYAEGKVNELLQHNKNVTYSEDLHLGVSLRSFRAEKLSSMVHSLLALDGKASSIYSEIKDKYPIMLTRDMEKAKRWLHKKVRGSERTGVLITKESARYKPLGIHVLQSDEENAVHWFLEDKADTRASNYLEDAATEIQVQGLELDYTCLLWDADMRYENGQWQFYRFNGKDRWNKVEAVTESKQEQIKYMLNAYRVLLTRARAGMIICIPEGNPHKTPTGFWEDETRLPEYYDGTYKYLKSIGFEEI